MPDDIQPILRQWPYVPDEITARVIEGEGGEKYVQLRLDLGLLQMAMNGRPDGQRVNGYASWLDFHRDRQEQHDLEHPDSARYLLETEDCAELLREGLQYYQRYLSFWHLGMYEMCARDTSRNLELFRFVREHAQSDRDKMQFDQWRPYVTMMHTRAVATPLIELRQWDAALGVIDAGIRGLQQFLEEYGQTEAETQLGELTFLRRWHKEVAANAGIEDAATYVPETDPIVILRTKLQGAIEEERYEDAAELRDQLRRLEDPPPPNMP